MFTIYAIQQSPITPSYACATRTCVCLVLRQDRAAIGGQGPDDVDAERALVVRQPTGVERLRGLR